VSDALQRVEHRALLRPDLRLGRQVLQAAAAAPPEVRAARFDALG
jgi:hypothetical protein